MSVLAQHTKDDAGLLPQSIARGFARAYAAARQFYGSTAPNPPVGCVLLDAKGEIIGVGAHQKAGGPHAEVAAIAAAQAHGRGGDIHTLIVTLEPCNHHGRTPPCSLEILSTPARHIWIGQADGNPKVEGGGAARLAAEGRHVHWLDELAHPDQPKLRAQIAALIAPFNKAQEAFRPYVVVKQALDPHGAMLPPKGQKTFTSPSSLRLAHLLRKRSDAILTGSGTVLADDPSFTVRHMEDFAGKTRTLIVLDRRGRVPQSYLEAARARGFDVWVRRDLEAALKELVETGHLQVLLEAGPSLTEAVKDAQLWDLWVRIDKAGEPGANDRISVNSPQGPLPGYKELPCFQE